MTFRILLGRKVWIQPDLSVEVRFSEKKILCYNLFDMNHLFEMVLSDILSTPESVL